MSEKLCVMTVLETKKLKLPVLSFMDHQILSPLRQVNNAFTKISGLTILSALEQKPLSNNVSTHHGEVTIVIHQIHAFLCFVEMEALIHQLKS